MGDIQSNQSESQSLTQIVPNSREAEEAVIGSVLINPESYYDVAQFLNAEDFYIHRHRWIWEVFQHLNETRTPIDFLTVTEELSQRGNLAEIGGAGYITDLINNTPTSMHASAYGELVADTALRRRMIEAANEIARVAYKEEVNVETAIEQAEKAVFGVSEQRLKGDLKPIRAVLGEYVDRISNMAGRDDAMVGVPTGFIDLDRILGGLQPSDFLIIAGRPGTGKTSFMMSVAKNAAQMNNKHIAIFSMEMSNEQLVQRLLSQETTIDSQRLRLGKLNDNEWPLFGEAIEVLGNTKIFLDDTPAITPTQMRAKCRRLHAEHKLHLIVIDYLQLMSSDSRDSNRVQEVSYISRNLKVLARELNVPVLAGAQLSRSIEQRAGKVPQLSDLRESGSLEQDADIVMFIHRPEEAEEDPTQQGVVEIRVSKHRNGPTGNIKLIFRSELARFENAATEMIDLE